MQGCVSQQPRGGRLTLPLPLPPPPLPPLPPRPALSALCCRRGLAHAPAAAATGARRRRPPAAAPQQQRPPPSSRRPALAAAAAPGDAAQPSTQQPPEALHAGPPSPPPTPAEVEAAASSAPAFAAVLRRLVERGGGATEAHVVAAWATQRHSPALRLAPAGAARRVSHKQQEVLEALVLLEELTRQQLVALAPDQLGFVARWGRGGEGWQRGRSHGLPQPARPHCRYHCTCRHAPCAGAMSWRAARTSRCCLACSRRHAAGDPTTSAPPGWPSWPGRWRRAGSRCPTAVASCCVRRCRAAMWRGSPIMNG